MPATATRNAAGQTADMRASIHNQIQVWAGQANWADPERAERVFAKMGQTTEDYISPDPETCGSYREEASRIYHEIKDEYGLRTVTEAREAAREYDDRRKQAAARTLRREFAAIEAGDREQLVADIADEYGDEFVGDVLAAERLERGGAADGAFPDPTPEPEPEPEPATDTDPTPTDPETLTTDRQTAVAPTGGSTAGSVAHVCLWALVIGVLSVVVHWPDRRTVALWALVFLAAVGWRTLYAVGGIAWQVARTAWALAAG